MDEKQALAQLVALSKVEGALKIIRWQLRDGNHDGDPRVPADGVDVKRVDVWEWADVVEISKPDERGRVTAYSAPYQAPDGRTTRDYTQGHPSAVLAKLQEWQRPEGAA